MSQSSGIVAVVPMSRAAFRRFCAGPEARTFARRLHEALAESSGCFVLRHVGKLGVLLYVDVQERGRSALQTELVSALLASAQHTCGRGVVLLSPHLPTLEQEGPSRIWLVEPGVPAVPASAEGLVDELARVQRLLRDEFWADESVFELASVYKRSDVVPASIRRAYTEQVREEQRASLHAALRAATPERPVAVFEGMVFDGKVCRSFGRVLDGADPFTLRRLCRRLVADARYVWCFDRRVSGADGATFDIIGGVDSDYAADACGVYYGHAELVRLAGADRATFRCSGCFGFDRERAFCRGILLDAEPPFSVVSPYNFLVAKNGVFHEDRRLPFDPLTFEVVESHDSTNPFLGPFTVRDKQGEHRYVRPG